MELSMPSGFVPRYSDFELVGFLDETMREGAERCPFSVPGDEKVDLALDILRTGVRDIIFGSAPDDPTNIAKLVVRAHDDELINPQWTATFILLLNCWEPIYEGFKSFPGDLKDHVVISLAMLDFGAKEGLFEHVVGKFRELGFTKFRVSLLNNFKNGVDDKKYLKLTGEIDRSVACGITTVRINDSLGEIFPETLAILCANLRVRYPKLNFCLHAHDDHGLGLQNALTSIYYGFDIVEAAFSGFGNRSGLPSIETLSEIFREKRIAIQDVVLSTKRLIETGRRVEEVFLAVPNVYRATSGIVVNWENLGVANIPDYLGTERNAKRFLNDVGLHPQTILRLMEDAPRPYLNHDFLPEITERLRTHLTGFYEKKRLAYADILRRIQDLYNDEVIFESDAKKIVHTLMLGSETVVS